jgi:hypothetical protein
MSMGMLKFKLDKHQDKIIEAFQRHNEDGRGEDTITLSKMGSILDDMAYIGGTIFCKYSEFE